MPQQKMMGYTIDGGFGEYATAYAQYVVKVPEGVDSFDAATLTCAGVTTYKAVKSQAPARPISLPYSASAAWDTLRSSTRHSPEGM